MAETFNPIITHLYSGQGGTSTEVTKYNNSTISEINVVDNGITTKYDFGCKYIEKMYSGNRVWNQYADCTNPSSLSQAGNVVSSKLFTFNTDHKYLFIFDGSFQTSYTGCRFTAGIWNNAMTAFKRHIINADSLRKRYAFITSGVTALDDGSGTLSDFSSVKVVIQCIDSSSVLSDSNKVTISNVQCIDITLIYGIGNEPTTVAEFTRKYSNEYYPYDPGTLFSTATELFRTIKQPIDSIKFYGNTMRWCQLCKDPTFATPSMWDLNASMMIQDNKVIMQGTDNSSTAFSMVLQQNNRFNGVNGHTYMFSAIVTSSVQTTGAQFRVFTGSEWGYPGATTIPEGTSRVSVIWTFNKTSSENCRLYFYTSVAGVSGGLPEGETMVMENLQVFDLTYNFGEGNEPSSSAEFTRRLRKLVYPYSPGEILSTEQASAYLCGLNIWDEEWEIGVYNTDTGEKADIIINKIRSKNYIRVFGGEQYYAECGINADAYLQPLFYDAQHNYIEEMPFDVHNQIFDVPLNACFMTFYMNRAYGAIYNHDICISLSNVSTNGTYEASKGEQSIRLLSTNIYDRRLDTTNSALNSSGNITTNSKRLVSGYIDISGSSYVSMTYGASYAFYNESKVFISGETKSYSVFRSYAIPSGAKYIRIDNIIDTISGQDIMMVVGQYTSETLPSYVPYGYGYATLNGVGDAVDTVTVNENNTGSYVKNVGSYTFTGNETTSIYGDGCYFHSSIFQQAPKLGTSNILSAVLHYVSYPAYVQTDENGININENEYVYVGKPVADLVGVTIYYELATPVETTLTAEECAEILNGAFTKSKYSTLLIDNDNGQIDQTVDITLWEQR